MKGQSPGVSISSASAQPGEGYKINIRGLGTVGNATPLYNANFTLDNKMLGVKADGKFMFFEDKMQMVTYGADVIHDDEQGGNDLISWRAPLAVKILTADQMQLLL